MSTSDTPISNVGSMKFRFDNCDHLTRNEISLLFEEIGAGRQRIAELEAQLQSVFHAIAWRRLDLISQKHTRGLIMEETAILETLDAIAKEVVDQLAPLPRLPAWAESLLQEKHGI